MQNFLGMIGVGQNPDLSFLNRPLVPLYVIVLVAVAALIAAGRLIIRRPVPETTTSDATR